MRQARRILLYSALGVITALATSWAMALATDLSAAPRYNRRSGVSMTGCWDPARNTVWTFRSVGTPGVLQMSLGNLGAAPPEGFQTVPADAMITPDQAPGWCTIRRGDARGVHSIFYIEQAFGWPWLAMAQRHRFARGEGADCDGLVLPEGLFEFARGRHVPVRPITMGFLGNAALFGWMWFALLIFPTVLRRVARRHRGACASCGYDVRYTPGSPCPECGAPPGPTQPPAR